MASPFNVSLSLEVVLLTLVTLSALTSSAEAHCPYTSNINGYNYSIPLDTAANTGR